METKPTARGLKYEYEGEWVNNKKEGEGEFKLNDLFTYTGKFTNDKIWGEGHMYIPKTGVTMIGEYSPDQYNRGFVFNGSVNYKDGSTYVGILHNYQKTWRNDEKTTPDPIMLANQEYYDIRFGSKKDPISIGVDLEEYMNEINNNDNNGQIY